MKIIILASIIIKNGFLIVRVEDLEDGMGTMNLLLTGNLMGKKLKNLLLKEIMASLVKNIQNRYYFQIRIFLVIVIRDSFWRYDMHQLDSYLMLVVHQCFTKR